MNKKIVILFILFFLISILFCNVSYGSYMYTFSDNNNYEFSNIPTENGYDCLTITKQHSSSGTVYFCGYLYKSEYSLVAQKVSGRDDYCMLYLVDSSGASVNDLLFYTYNYNKNGFLCNDGFVSRGILSSSSGFGYVLDSVYTTKDILDKTSNEVVYIGNKTVKTPFITNSSDVLSTGNFDYLCINSGDFYGEDFQDFYLLAYNYYASDVENLNVYAQKEILISAGNSSNYFSSDRDGSYIYMIPMSDLGIVFRNNGKYGFKLATKKQVEFEGNMIDTYDYFFEISFVVENLDLEDEERNFQDTMISQLEEQKKQLEESNKNSKNIFEKIGDILSYINPLSENFFAYKLLDLLYEGLKALFIPSDEFFSNWFTDLNNTFKEQFGILYYPVGVIIEFLNSLEPNLVAHDPIINIPNLSFDLFGQKFVLISATSYNLNSILENSNFATVHTYYLFFVNVILTIGVIAFASKIAIEIFGGVDDTATQIIDSQQQKQAQKRPLGYKPNTRRGSR